MLPSLLRALAASTKVASRRRCSHSAEGIKGLLIPRTTLAAGTIATGPGLTGTASRMTTLLATGDRATCSGHVPLLGVNAVFFLLVAVGFQSNRRRGRVE